MLPGKAELQKYPKTVNVDWPASVSDFINLSDRKNPCSASGKLCRLHVERCTTGYQINSKQSSNYRGIRSRLSLFEGLGKTVRASHSTYAKNSTLKSAFL